MAALKLLLLLCSGAIAAVIPRDNYVPDGYCCFTLNDAATGNVVQQDRTSGFLYFDAKQPNGWYCMNSSEKGDVLRDDLWNACILDWNDRFQCLDPILGSNAWTLGYNDNKLLLSHDKSSGYKACPNTSGGEIIKSDTAANAAGCRNIRLAAQGLKGACSGFTG